MQHVSVQLLAETIRQGLSRGDRVPLRVISGSMQPLIRVGDEVILEQVKIEQLKVNDIITVDIAEEFITHRLIGMTPKSARTRGDRVPQLDPPISLNDIIGKVVALRRGSKVRRLDEGRGRVIAQLNGSIAAAQYRLHTKFGSNIIIRLLRRGLYVLAKVITDVAMV